MKQAFAVMLLTALVVGGLYYASRDDREVQQVVIVETGPYFDFVYEPPEDWDIWEGMSANISTFATGDIGIDPYDVEVMQAYLDQWSIDTTDTLVFVPSGTVDTTSRDYMTVMKAVELHAAQPLTLGTINMILYDTEHDFSFADTVSDIHTRMHTHIAGVEGDYFRMSSQPKHDSVNLTISYKGKTISFYTNVPKDMSDEDVLNKLTPFVEQIPF